MVQLHLKAHASLRGHKNYLTIEKKIGGLIFGRKNGITQHLTPMDLLGLKEKHIRELFGISAESFPRALAIIDFGNVNYWFERDDQADDGTPLPEDQRLAINLEGLRDFLSLFCEDVRFYYGFDPINSGSCSFMGAAKHVFGKNRVFTKPIQKTKHYLDSKDIIGTRRSISHDPSGDYIIIPKCSFDVEISVDAIRLLERYDTFCLLSSDADFVSLLRFLKGKNKKLILIKGGRIQGALGELLNIKINAQDIKQYIAMKKQKPGS